MHVVRFKNQVKNGNENSNEQMSSNLINQMVFSQFDRRLHIMKVERKEI